MVLRSDLVDPADVVPRPAVLRPDAALRGALWRLDAELMLETWPGRLVDDV